MYGVVDVTSPWTSIGGSTGGGACRGAWLESSHAGCPQPASGHVWTPGCDDFGEGRAVSVVPSPVQQQMRAEFEFR